MPAGDQKSSHITLYFFICIVCDGGFYQENDKTICSAWFDYTNGCYDSTCDGDTRLSLTSDAKTWLATNKPDSNQTSSIMCASSAPWPLSYTEPLFEVYLMCQQICDYCIPSTTSTTSTTTTTATNTCKLRLF